MKEQIIVETHVHICEPRYDVDRDEMLKRSFESGVKKLINIGADIEENKKVADFDRDGIYKSIGLHPHYIDKFNEDVFNEIKGYIVNKKNIVAVGEIGLDYFKSPSSKENQILIFKKFLSVAKEYNLPVVIHSRDAHDDVYNILKEYNLEKKGVIHCFTGNFETAQKFIDIGYLIGIGGVITFPNAAILKDTVRKLPLEFMVLETDAPWLAPQQYRGKRNEPAYLKYIIEKIAEIKNISVDEVIINTTKNAEKIFNI
ncbi:MAG: TatD family hydrolase [Candidatus Goldbacteria bacterium]|nr:TatD family hydrolase [Candidatus Goldiibacteriota bacterium]